MSADAPLPRGRCHWRHRIWMRGPSDSIPNLPAHTPDQSATPARRLPHPDESRTHSPPPHRRPRPIAPALLLAEARGRRGGHARASCRMLKPVAGAVSDALVREQVLQPSAMTALRRLHSLPTVRFISRLPRGRHNVRVPQSTHRHSDLPPITLRQTIQGNDRRPVGGYGYTRSPHYLLSPSLPLPNGRKERLSKVTSNHVVLNPGSLCENRSHQREIPAVSFLDYSRCLYMFYLSHLAYLTRRSLRA